MARPLDVGHQPFFPAPGDRDEGLSMRRSLLLTPRRWGPHNLLDLHDITVGRPPARRAGLTEAWLEARDLQRALKALSNPEGIDL